MKVSWNVLKMPTRLTRINNSNLWRATVVLFAQKLSRLDYRILKIRWPLVVKKCSCFGRKGFSGQRVETKTTPNCRTVKDEEMGEEKHRKQRILRQAHQQHLRSHLRLHLWQPRQLDTWDQWLRSSRFEVPLGFLPQTTSGTTDVKLNC